jgi:hypothetical protein
MCKFFIIYEEWRKLPFYKSVCPSTGLCTTCFSNEVMMTSGTKTLKSPRPFRGRIEGGGDGNPHPNPFDSSGQASPLGMGKEFSGNFWTTLS